MRRFVRPLLLAFIVLLAASPALAERKVALVVGNGAYVHVPKLTNPTNDARLMADTLASVGFQLVGGKPLLNASKQDIEKAIREFGQKLQGGAVGLFYYAGHGVQVRGQNFLIPVTANVASEADVKYEFVDAGFVLDEMNQAGNKLNIVILDACRNNPFGGRGLRSTGSGLAQVSAPEGSVISYATQPGNVAIDGTGSNSPYTEALAAAIRTPGKDVFGVFNDVGLRVKRATGGKQQPWLATSPIEGQFYFTDGQVASLPSSGGSAPSYSPPSVSPAPAVPGGPQATSVDLGSIEQKGAERAKAEAASKQQWATWLSGMKSAVGQAQALEKKPGVSASDKAEAWVLLASKYTQKSPYTGEDDTLRAQMAKQADYWTGQAKSEAAAQAKAETARQEAERKRVEQAQKLAQAKADAEAAAAAKKQQLLAMAPTPKQPPGISAPIQAPVGTPGQTWRDPVTGMEFVWVPGGSFEMGCGSWTSDCYDNEKPVHSVRLSGYWLAKYEVTQGQWQKVMGSNPSYFKKGDNYPVEKVSWNDAKEFISKLNAQGSVRFRLPTEAEWEYAARSGGKAEKYAGGNDIDNVAWYTGNSGGSTHAVGAKAPNGLGLYDMSGNVWEWCEDVFASYSSSSQDNPVVTGGGSSRLSRGGSWDNGPRFVRASIRNADAPDIRFVNVGFRLARTN